MTDPRSPASSRPPTAAATAPTSSARPRAEEAQPVFTEFDMEAALCSWEAMIAFRELQAREGSVSPRVDQMLRLWDDVGSIQMRRWALQAARHVQDAFVEVGALLENSPYAFDFEFVPAVIANLVWSADGPQPPGTRDHFLRTVAASMKRLDPDDVD